MKDLKEFEPEMRKKKQLTLRIDEEDLEGVEAFAKRHGFRNAQSVILAMVRKGLHEDSEQSKTTRDSRFEKAG